MVPVDESAVPPARKAKAVFTAAMDQWDDAAADAAIAGLARSSGANEIYEILFRYGEIAHSSLDRMGTNVQFDLRFHCLLSQRMLFQKLHEFIRVRLHALHLQAHGFLHLRFASHSAH